MQTLFTKTNGLYCCLFFVRTRVLRAAWAWQQGRKTVGESGGYNIPPLIKIGLAYLPKSCPYGLPPPTALRAGRLQRIYCVIFFPGPVPSRSHFSHVCSGHHAFQSEKLILYLFCMNSIFVKMPCWEKIMISKLAKSFEIAPRPQHEISCPLWSKLTLIHFLLF